jgi:thiol-disulfide isomerase/thioredoxin
MTALDPTVARVLDRQPRGAESDEDDEDALIAALEDDDDHTLSALREKRLEQLHSELSRARVLKEQPGHGVYTEIKDEKEVLDITTSTKLCVVHFMKPDFARCRIMDEKLRVLAKWHFETRFLAVDVGNAPWLVVKLGVQVLPCVICFVDGVGVDRVIGFEGIGTQEVMGHTITTRDLEERLLRSGVLVRAKMGEEEGDSGKAEEDEQRKEEYDEDEDWN